MSASYRRYEILLPRRYNDGRAVPPRLIEETLIELRRKFGPTSRETQTIQGHWQHQSEIYHDLSVRVFVDVEDIAANRDFFLRFKKRLRQQFEQHDIYMTSHQIEVL